MNNFDCTCINFFVFYKAGHLSVFKIAGLKIIVIYKGLQTGKTNLFSSSLFFFS